MATRKDILDQSQHTSNKVSDLCRFVGFGVIAVAWTALNSTSDFATTIASDYRVQLVWSAIFGILTIAFDYLQFLSGYISAQSALASERNSYDKGSVSYKARRACFKLKQVTVGIGIGILLFVVMGSLKLD